MFEKALTPGPVRSACISVLLRILLPRTSVNKGEFTLSALRIHRGFIATDYSARSGV
jgi:hypothetical protein